MQPSTHEDNRGTHEVASVKCISEGSADYKQLPLRSLRYGVGLHLANDSTVNSVVGLPPALKLGAYYVPAEPPSVGGDRTLYSINANVPTRLYVLWPAMQEPPVWLHNDFERVRGADVKVRWGDFTFMQHFYLNVTNQHFLYEEQVQHVYKLIDNHGILQQGENIRLPSAPQQQLSSKQPYYSHVVCLHPISRSSTSGGGSTMDLHKYAAGPVRLGLQEIYSGLEDGSFDLRKLSIIESDTLLHRALAAEDEELLFMLLESGDSPHFSRPCLQLVLKYAQYENLPQLAQQILQQSDAELTRPVLDWLVQHIIKYGRCLEAEVFLSSYCRSRRNPLNAVAAVEYSLSKAANSSIVVDEAAVKVARKFGAAKMALLQQLVQRHEGEQSTAANLRRSQSGMNSANSQTRSPADVGGASESPLQLEPLLAALRQCLQEADAHMLGRRSSDTATSIHDSSPYTFAVGLEDTDFLRTPAVRQYTRKLWSGLELQTIAQAACKAAAVATAEGKQKSLDWGMVGGTRKSKQHSVARSSLTGATVQVSSASRPAGLQIPTSGSPIAASRSPSPCYPVSSLKAASWTNLAASVDLHGVTSPSGRSKSCLNRNERADFDDNSVAESLVWLNPDVGVELLQNMGLGGLLGQPFARAGTSLLHTLLLTPRALHDAARGRWLKRCFFEGIFLVLYEVYCKREAPLAVYPLLIWMVANLASSVLEVQWLHEGSFNQYFRDNWAKLDVLVNGGLLGICMWELYLRTAGTASVKGNALEALGVELQQVVPAALSVLVWTRALGVVQPVSERMGALMYTLKRAAAEAVMLVPLVVVLIFGFATTLHVVYRNVSVYYSTFLGALRMATVFLLGGDHLLLEFSKPDESHGNAFLEVWGQVMIVLFGVVVNILIVSLLVAVITKTYNREQVNAKAVLVEAEAVRHYDWRVRHFLAVSPVNLIQMLLSWLPQGHRSRIAPASCFKYLIPPLDGYVPDTTTAVPELLLPTGAPEVGYTGFLLFLYPLISAAALVMIVVHLPFGVLYFAIRGHKMWISSWSPSTGNARLNKQNPAAAEAAAKILQQSRSTTNSVLGSVSEAAEAALNPGRRARFLQFVKGQNDGDASMLAPAANKVPVGRSPPVKVASVSADAKAAVNMWKVLRHAAGSLFEATFWFFDTLIEPPIRIGLAAVSGLIIHLVLLVLIITTLIWAWCTRLLFSLYCLFWPWAGNAHHQTQITRIANFWSKESIHDAFATANLLVGLTDDAVQGVKVGGTDTLELFLARPGTADGETACEVRVKEPNQANGLAAAPPGLAMSSGGQNSKPNVPGERMPAKLELLES